MSRPAATLNKRRTQGRPPMGRISFLDAMDDPGLFGPWFTPNASWAPWRASAKALFGLRITPREAELFSRCTGRTTAPTSPVREAWLPVGRRAGKSVFAAALAVFMACFRDYGSYLKPGERPVVMVLAADKDQAQVVFQYIEAFFDNIPMLSALVSKRGTESIELENRVTIRVQVASYRRIRGRTVVCAILDECAFWYSDEESKNPDTEIVKALRPSMLTIPGSLLVAISSPYAKAGVLWDAYRKHFGKDSDPVLVWTADTETMNPSVDRAIIEDAYEDDPASARAEYGAEFREDLESFVSPEVVDRLVVRGRVALPFEPGKRYVAFCDPAGGSGGDSMALAIVRVDKTVVVCRVVEWQPPFSPDQATRECAIVIKEYGLQRVLGDHYAGDWPADRFRQYGVTYERADRTKSDFYQALLPLINGQRVELLDHKRTIGQLLALERTTSRLGKDSISHPPRGHDDLINVVAAASVLAAELAARKSGGSVSAVTISTADRARAALSPYMVRTPLGEWEYCRDPRCD